MDRLEKSGTNENDGFIKTVFPFDESQKGTLLNILQYSILAIIPIVILLKVIKEYIPEADDDKGSIVISIEVIGQIFIMFVALYFIHQIIDFIPTYSGKKYGDVNIINIVAPILFIAITMQTKLGEKIHMLIDRLYDLYDGQVSNKQPQQGKDQVRVTQPISGQPPYVVNPPPQLQSQMTNMKAQSHEFTIPQTPNFDNMYAGPETHLVGAATPQGNMTNTFEPMASNDGFGAFGTAF